MDLVIILHFWEMNLLRRQNSETYPVSSEIQSMRTPDYPFQTKDSAIVYNIHYQHSVIHSSTYEHILVILFIYRYTNTLKFFNSYLL